MNLNRILYLIISSHYFIMRIFLHILISAVLTSTTWAVEMIMFINLQFIRFFYEYLIEFLE